jgi:outer membrane protein TolC
VTSAEAAVALQEQVIIAAEAQLQNANDALIRALYPVTTGRPDRLEPTDAPTLSHIQVDEPTAEKMALDRRVELKVAKLSKESASALRVAAENRTKPQLDAFVAYNGLSDNYNGLGSVNSDLSQSRYPGYSVGLAFSFPIPNRTARGNLAQAHANERSSELPLKDQELGILLQVRQVFRNVDASEKGVEAARKTRVFREKDLDAEQKKFENGMSTNFLVLSKQNDLDAARAAELQAQITYAKSVTAQEQSVGNLMEARGFQYPQ